MRISPTSERFAISQSILVWAPHAFSYQIFVDSASTSTPLYRNSLGRSVILSFMPDDAPLGHIS